MTEKGKIVSVVLEELFQQSAPVTDAEVQVYAPDWMDVSDTTETLGEAGVQYNVRRLAVVGLRLVHNGLTYSGPNAARHYLMDRANNAL